MLLLPLVAAVFRLYRPMKGSVVFLQ